MSGLLLLCASGISGDMTVAALIDMGLPIDLLRAALASAGLSDVHLDSGEVIRGGLRARTFSVNKTAKQPPRSYLGIAELFRRADITPRARELSAAMLRQLAHAEARLHGCDLDEVTFHEIGAFDTIADLLGVGVGLDYLDVSEVFVGPIETGAGHMATRHGVMAIPAPATLELLSGLEITSTFGGVELCTPTGAAILAGIGARPMRAGGAFVVSQTGYGAGGREVADRPNVLVAALIAERSSDSHDDQVTLLETNLDDRSGEFVGESIRQLISLGALDAWATPMVGKKGRPAVVLSVLCKLQDKANLLDALFVSTGSLGVRMSQLGRVVLERRIVEVEYRGHCFRVKVGPHGSKIEFEDLAAASKELGEPVLSLAREVALHFSREHPEYPLPL